MIIIRINNSRKINLILNVLWITGGMPSPIAYCRDVYNYAYDKPNDYGDEAVFIPQGIYFTDVERERYKLSIKLKNIIG